MILYSWYLSELWVRFFSVYERLNGLECPCAYLEIGDFGTNRHADSEEFVESTDKRVPGGEKFCVL